MHRRSMMIGPPLLFLAAFLWTTEAWGALNTPSRAEAAGPAATKAPVDRAPDVLCGCTEVLKNFA